MSGREMEARLTGPVSPGAVRVHAGNGEVLGHAYTEVLEGGGGQVERWLLYADPLNDFALEASPELSGIDLSGWRERVSTPRSEGGLWEDTACYIKANATLYRHGEPRDGHDWRTIPFPPPAPPWDTYRGPVNPSQVDPGGGKILQRRVDRQILEGHVFSTASVNEPTSAEYWYLPDGFEHGGTSGVTTSLTPEIGLGAALFKLGVRSRPRRPRSPSSMGLRLARRLRGLALETGADLGIAPAHVDLEQFVADMNQRWRPGDAFAVTACSNYWGLALAGMPSRVP